MYCNVIGDYMVRHDDDNTTTLIVNQGVTRSIVYNESDLKNIINNCIADNKDASYYQVMLKVINDYKG